MERNSIRRRWGNSGRRLFIDFLIDLLQHYSYKAINRRKVGDIGERFARKYLVQKGYTIIQSNVHLRFAELDIVAARGGKYYFFEVKLRNQTLFGRPEESINQIKRLRFWAAVRKWMAINGISEEKYGGSSVISALVKGKTCEVCVLEMY